MAAPPVTENIHNGLDAEREREREFAGKVLSVCFTLLGILVGVFGIVIGQFISAGSWEDSRAEVAPFLVFIATLIAFDCVVCVLALLNVAGHVRSALALVIAVSMMLATIALFAGARTVQLLVN